MSPLRQTVGAPLFVLSGVPHRGQRLNLISFPLQTTPLLRSFLHRIHPQRRPTSLAHSIFPTDLLGETRARILTRAAAAAATAASLPGEEMQSCNVVLTKYSQSHALVSSKVEGNLGVKHSSKGIRSKLSHGARSLNIGFIQQLGSVDQQLNFKVPFSLDLVTKLLLSPYPKDAFALG